MAFLINATCTRCGAVLTAERVSYIVPLLTAHEKLCAPAADAAEKIKNEADKQRWAELGTAFKQMAAAPKRKNSPRHN